MREAFESLRSTGSRTASALSEVEGTVPEPVEGLGLSVKNPEGGEEIVHRTPQGIMDEIAELVAESAEVLVKIKEFLCRN